MKKLLFSLLAIMVYVFILIFPPPLEVTGLFFRFQFGITFILWILLALAMRKEGARWEFFALTLTLLLFAMTLIYKWQAGVYNGQVFGGLLPWSDAKDYYSNAQLLLQGGDLNSFGSRRPLFNGLLGTLFWLTGNRLKVSVAVLVAINGISAFLAGREIQKTFNTFSASLFIVLYYLYFIPYSGTVTSEDLGLSLGALSLAIFLKWTRDQSDLRLLGIGFFVLTTALNARAGAFFILPALLLWGGGFSVQKKSLDLRVIAIGTAAIALAMVGNFGLTKFLSSPGNLPFSNYSYTLYGLASGYKGWNQAMFDHPGASPEEIYRYSFEIIRSEPLLFVRSVVSSYQDFFTPTNGAFSFLRLIHDQRNRGDHVLWLLTIIALISSLFWGRDKPYGLILAAFAGIFASAGLLPPCDSDSMRAYAATIPFAIYIVSTIMAAPGKIISRQAEVEPDPAGHDHSFLLLPFTAVLIISSALLPFIVRWSGSPGTGAAGTLSCPSGQEEILFTIGRQSSLALIPDASLRESYAPLFRFTDFKNSIEYGPYHGTFPSLDAEILNNIEGDQAITIGMVGGVNSKPNHAGFLVTTGAALGQGVRHICARPSDDENMDGVWYYQDDGEKQVQTAEGSIFQAPLFVTTATRLLYALGLLIILFMVVTPPDGFMLSAWKERILMAGCILFIIASIAVYLHRTAMLPFAWETGKLDMKNAVQVDGYLYQLPLAFNWMDQQKIPDAPVDVYEDGIPLRNPGSKIFAIKNVGKGRFTIQNGYLFLSASDNSDAINNGKTYEIHWPTPIHPIFEFIIYAVALSNILFLMYTEQKSKYNQGRHLAKAMQQVNIFDAAGSQYQQIRINHWDQVAQKQDHWQGMGRWYHRRLGEVYRYLINPRQRVLEIGCGMGSLLAGLQPSRGVGLDFSSAMIERAKRDYPHFEFYQLDAHDLSSLEGEFDVIILSDTVNDLWDVQRVLGQLRRFCLPHTRVILNFYSHLWQLPLAIAQGLNLAAPMLRQNWLTRADIDNMLRLAGFESIRSSQEVLWPLPLGGAADRFLVKLWPFREFALSNFVIARPEPQVADAPSVSVVIAARNEAGNIKSIFDRVPKMGSRTEIVFVEGHSHDNTYETIEREIALHPSTPSLLFRQPGIGKADAIRLGFEKATGDILMILDADLTVPPEDLPRFYDAIVSGKGEFINGVRLVYPMEKEAMRTLNFIGNKLFSMMFSWLLGQPVKDTLCGTKVMWRDDYAKIAANRSYFGDFDPFGDFDLIFGAAKLNRKIIDLPVRYRDRTYGTTNISRWKHGLLLLRMVLFAARRIKFV